jgi:hypothetical protein
MSVVFWVSAVFRSSGAPHTGKQIIHLPSKSLMQQKFRAMRGLFVVRTPDSSRRA